MRGRKAASDLFGLIFKVSKWKLERNNGYGGRLLKAQVQGMPSSSWWADPVPLTSPGGIQLMPHRALLCATFHIYCYIWMRFLP